MSEPPFFIDAVVDDLWQIAKGEPVTRGRRDSILRLIVWLNDAITRGGDQIKPFEFYIDDLRQEGHQA